MTVYQAVKQFSSVVNDQSETEADTETPIGNLLFCLLDMRTIFHQLII